MLYGVIFAVYCDTRTKRRLYGQNVIFFFGFKLGGICSNNWTFKCQIYYLYLLLLHQNNMDDVFNYLDYICDFGGSTVFRNVGIRLFLEVS